MTFRWAARALVAGPLGMTALACGSPALRSDYAGECALGSSTLPFTLTDMALDEAAVVNGGDPNWEVYVGIGTIDGVPEENRETRAEGIYCFAEEGCTDPLSGQKEQGTMILSFIRSFDLTAVMVAEGQEDGDQRWDGVCWLLTPPTRDIADFGTFEMSAK